MKILLRVLDHIAGIRILGRARPAAAFFLLVGIPGYGVFTAILLAYRASITAKIPELATYYLALTWGWMGMAIIWYYYFPLLASFKKSIVTIMVKVPENLETVTTGGTLANTLVLMWALLVAYAFLSAFSYIQSKIGVVPGSAGYYVALAGVFLFGCVTGVGGLFVLNTMLLVRRICRQREFVIDVYNVDNMGGLSAVGKLTLISTLLCSSGAVCIPALVTVAKTIGSMHSMALYLLALLASIGILVSFLYPNFIVYRKMQVIAQRDLENLSISLSVLSKRMLSGIAGEDDLALFSATRKYYWDVKSVHLFPLNTGTLLPLASSVLLPLVMTVLQAYLSKNM